MKNNNINHALSLELQKSFLMNFKKTNPSQFRELAKMLRSFSKGKIEINELYSKLSGNFTLFLHKALGSFRF
jgi:hypothetical protein